MWCLYHGCTSPIHGKPVGYKYSGTAGACILLFSKSSNKTIWGGLPNINGPDVKSVSISGLGDYFVVGEDGGNNIYLFHHKIPIPIPPVSEDDDDDDDKLELTVPFGNSYLLFTIIGLVSLIILTKRKAIQEKK